MSSRLKKTSNFQNTKTKRNKTTNKTQNKPTKNKTQKIYTTSDYESNNGFLTTVWGPCVWTFLHTVSFNYPVYPTSQEKKHYKEFVLQLSNILPCGKCRKNFKKNLKKLPLTDNDMVSRETFSKYMYQLHETVNTMLNKNSHLTYEMVRDRFENFRAHCVKQKSNKPINKPINKEIGCIKPLYGVKSKCVINIVPQAQKTKSFNIDNKCLLQR